MLGRELTKHHLSCGNSVYGVSRHFSSLLPRDRQFNVDLSQIDFEQSISSSFKPDLVLHTAAYTDLKYCELNQEQTIRFHAENSGRLARLFRNTKFIYFSTDSVFDGQRGNYSELDEVNPLNLYALSKQKGEEAVLGSKSSVYVFRTNIVGFHEPIKSSLFEWAVNALQAHEQINGFSNVYFNPLYCSNYGSLIDSFLERNPDLGIYNFAAADSISKYDFLRKIAQEMNFDELLISPIELINEQGGVIRPLNTTLNIDKAKSVGVNFPTMQIMIQQLCKDFKNSIHTYGI